MFQQLTRHRSPSDMSLHRVLLLTTGFEKWTTLASHTWEVINVPLVFLLWELHWPDLNLIKKKKQRTGSQYWKKTTTKKVTDDPCAHQAGENWAGNWCHVLSEPQAVPRQSRHRVIALSGRPNRCWAENKLSTLGRLGMSLDLKPSIKFSELIQHQRI